MALPSAILLPPDTRANQPSAASVAAGTLYCVSDEGNILEQSDGAAWVAYSPVGSGSGDVTASNPLTASALVVGDGSTAIDVLASLGTTTTVLHGNAAGLPTFGAVVEADITLADNTTNDVTTSAHGFAPKLSNVATEYLDGTGAYSVPAGSGGGGLNYGFTAPVDGDFAWINQGTASVASVTLWGGTAITLTVPHAAATDINLISRVQSAPATPYVITAYWSGSLYTNNYYMAGLVFRESGSGKLVFFGPECNAGVSDEPIMTVMYCADNVTISSRYVSETGRLWGGHLLEGWWRIADNGTNRIFSVSNDGQNWVEVLSQGRTTDMTPDQVGFTMSSRNQDGTARDRYLDLLSWEET